MDAQKIGAFIKELRTEKGLSQYKLAEILFVSRESISKWERGIGYPSNSCLIKMSKLFNVSINELLFGERENKGNKNNVTKVALSLYEDRNKKNKKLKISILVIITLILSFLTYYFINTYNSLKVYNIGYSSNDITITNGLFVYTKEKIYFSLGNIDTNYDISKLRLYYKNKEEEKNIFTTDSSFITLVEFKSKESVFYTKSIKDILSNLFLEIILENDKKELKLDFVKSFSNNYIFPSVPEQIEKNIELKYNQEIEGKIKKNFKKDSDVYIYKEKNYVFTYIPEAKSLNLIMIENDISKEWNYVLISGYLEFNEYNDVKTFNSFSYDGKDMICNINMCRDEEVEITKFNNLLQSILVK